jgi:HlyD family secretion protein
LEDELQKLRIDKAHKARREEPSRMPWLVLLLLIAIVAIAIWQWQSRAGVITVQTMRVRPIEGAASQQADQVLLTATGYVMAAHKIELAAKVVGRVAWVGVEMGDKITKGQELVRLEDDEFKARVAQQQGQLDAVKAQLAELEAGSRPQEIAAAAARLDQAKAELANAEVSLKRLKELESSGSISKQQVDDAEAAVRSRSAAVETQKQNFELSKIGPRKEQIDAQAATVRQWDGMLALTKIDLGNTVIKAPIDATVLERNVEVGEFVTTGFVGERGAKGYVLSIADLNDLRVELDVSQNDFAKVTLHQPCTLWTDAYPDRKYKGDVDLISPEANRTKATVLVRVKVLNPDTFLKPDMNATVSFLAAARSATTTAASVGNVIRIPSSAAREGGVFVVENGRAVRRSVESTKVNNELEIRKGLIGGEDLIVSPPATLQDGDKVRAEGK